MLKTITIPEPDYLSSPRSYRLGVTGLHWPLVAVGAGVMSFAILLVVAPDIFVPDTSLGWVDAWYYVSLALKLPQRVAQYRWLYQSERIGWTLPAYVVNRVATPLVANFIVKGLFFTTAVLFLFGSVKEITGSLRTAAFVSAVAAFHSFLLHSLGTSYVDGPMNTYLLGSLYFGTRAFSNRGPRGSGFWAGAFFGAQLLTHLVALVLVPSFVVYWVLTWTRTIGRRPSILRVALELSAGTVAVVAGAFALYGHWGAGTFPFHLSLIFMFSNTVNALVRPTSDVWLFHALWLLLPAAVLAWTVVAIAGRLARAPHWSTVLRLPPVYVLLVAVSACWTALYVLHEPWLMLPYYSSYLLPFTFVAFGRIVVTSVEVLSPTAYRRLMVAAFLLGGLSYRLSTSMNADAAVSVAVMSLAAATSLRLRPRRHTSAAFPLLVVAAAALINCASADYTPQLWNAFRATAMNAVYVPAMFPADSQIPRTKRFEAAIAAADRLALHLSGNSGRRYFFWYDGQDELGMFYRSVTSMMFAWSTSHLLGEDFHGFDERNQETLASYGDTAMADLVLLTRSPHIDAPDPRFTVRWTDSDKVGGIEYFTHYLTFEPAAPQLPDVVIESTMAWADASRGR